MPEIKTLQRGVTLIEFAIAMVILGILVAVGYPSMVGWLQSTAVKSAAEFYAEGLQLARLEAVRRNASARFVIGTPDANGWSVDWCQATAGQPCDGNGAWTNVVQRSGTAFSDITISFCPGGSTQVDFTSVGWVNTQVSIPIGAIRIDPPNSDIRSSQVEIPLSGMGSICMPNAGAGDSRACQVSCP